MPTGIVRNVSLWIDFNWLKKKVLDWILNGGIGVNDDRRFCYVFLNLLSIVFKFQASIGLVETHFEYEISLSCNWYIFVITDVKKLLSKNLPAA